VSYSTSADQAANGALEITIPVLEGVLPKKVAVEVVPPTEKILAGATQ